jgi:hypothetical protein
LKTASPASWQPNRTRLSRQRPVALEGLLDARRSARETIREICLELRAIVSSLTAANNEAEILDLRATISRQDIVTNLTPKVSASLSLRHFSLRNAKMLTLTMSLKASVETLYLEVWTGRNTLGPKPRGHRIVQPWRPPKPLDRHLAREAVVGAVKADQPGDDPPQERRPVGRNGLQDGSLALERHDIARTPVTVGVARQVGYRLAGLAVDRDAIRFKANPCVAVSDDRAIPGEHVDDFRLIAVRQGGGDVGPTLAPAQYRLCVSVCMGTSPQL